jgi:hypothetical protein
MKTWGLTHLKMISSRTQNFLYSSKIKSQSTAAAHSTIRAIIAIAIVDIYKCFYCVYCPYRKRFWLTLSGRSSTLAIVRAKKRYTKSGSDVCFCTKYIGRVTITPMRPLQSPFCFFGTLLLPNWFTLVLFILLRQRLMTMIARTDRDIYRSRRRRYCETSHICSTGTLPLYLM